MDKAGSIYCCFLVQVLFSGMLRYYVKYQDRSIKYQDEFLVLILDTRYLLLSKSSGAYIGGVHLFPFRTEKLSPPEPMVLP